jgi:hypothetical protein
MKKGEKVLRLEEAVSYLISLGLVDGKATIKDISEKMNRHKNNVSSALSGDVRYLTWKFVKDFCATFNNTISPYWIWEEKGDMLKTLNEINLKDNKKEKRNLNDVSDESLSMLTKEQLISLVKQLIALHREQTAMYQMLISKNDQIINNSKERFNKIIDMVFKNI